MKKLTKHEQDVYKTIITLNYLSEEKPSKTSKNYFKNAIDKIYKNEYSDDEYDRITSLVSIIEEKEAMKLKEKANEKIKNLKQRDVVDIKNNKKDNKKVNKKNDYLFYLAIIILIALGILFI